MQRLNKEACLGLATFKKQKDWEIETTFEMKWDEKGRMTQKKDFKNGNETLVKSIVTVFQLNFVSERES